MLEQTKLFRVKSMIGENTCKKVIHDNSFNNLKYFQNSFSLKSWTVLVPVFAIGKEGMKNVYFYINY